MAEIVQIIFLKDGKIALGFRQNVHVLNNLWGFPGGRMEKNEKPHEAAFREAFEEVGVKPINLKDTFTLNDSYGNLHHFFICDLWSGELKNAEPELCREVIWTSLDKLPDNCTKIKYLAKDEHNNRLFTDAR